MKLHKTWQNERGVYRYPVNVADGEGGYKTEYITIKPGENGVTEADIKTLHSLDDSEVYNNFKNMRQKDTDEIKKSKKEWKIKYIESFEKSYGYKPNNSDVISSSLEVFPSKWNLSLDFLGDFIDRLTYKDNRSEIEETKCNLILLNQIINTLTSKQRYVFEMVTVKGYSLTEVAGITGTSVTNIKKHHNKAIVHISQLYKKYSEKG